MKVCILTYSIDKKMGGPARSVLSLANGLEQQGCKVTLCTIESDEMNTEGVLNEGVNLVTLAYHKQKASIEYFFSHNHFDLVHIQNIWLPFYHWAILILQKNHTPYIISPRGSLDHWCLNYKRFKKTIALYLYQRKDIDNASAIQTTSEIEAKHVHNLHFKSPISVIPNGIDVSTYSCRTEQSYAKIKKQVLFLSRIHPKKGIEVLIDAWELVHKEFPEWKVIIAGNGEERYIHKLSTRIESKHMTDCISIVPPIYGEEKRKLYCESSIFVLPSHSESFGMVIAEALACGVPVITSSFTPWKILNDSGSGWSIDLSVENLATSLANALSLNPKVLFDMGQRGRELIENNYNYTTVAQKNLQLYNWVLNKGTYSFYEDEES